MNISLFLIHCWKDLSEIFLFSIFLLDVFNNLMNFNDIKGVGGRVWKRFKKGGENFLCKKERKKSKRSVEKGANWYFARNERARLMSNRDGRAQLFGLRRHGSIGDFSRI